MNRAPTPTGRRLAQLTTLMVSCSFAGLAVIAPAQAATSTTPDAGWQKVTTDGGVGGTSTEGPFTFHADKLTKITVTDAYCHGDAFTVLDHGTNIGDTDEIPEELRNCAPRFFLSETVRADTSMMDPTFSHGTFYLAPGDHSLDLANKTIWNGTDSGSVAFFRLETVPLTKTDCMTDGWRGFGSLFQNQGQCVSLSMSIEHQISANIGTVDFAVSPFGTAARGLTPPNPNWHRWVGAQTSTTKYTAKTTVPRTQSAGNEVLTVTVPVSLTGDDTSVPAYTEVTLTMTGQPQFTSWWTVGLGQYGSLGNTAWELVGDPTIAGPSLATTWTFRTTAPITPGDDYDPIVISFDFGNFTSYEDVVYTFADPSTAIASATADGYATSTGSGWFQP